MQDQKAQRNTDDERSDKGVRVGVQVEMWNNRRKYISLLRD